ncbi:hypothetical protein ACH4GZ_39100 [Streptomyces hygroscopicus]|uniref:hypothetical protein n=1 Tax=Streptomyces hygroscopicus TaxID=1912 RepID=UPI00378D9CFF
MTVRLPDPQQPTATTAGQPTADDARQAAAREFLADLESAMQPTTDPDRVPAATSFRDHSPLPAVGTTPPVPQPGRPPMSQRAADISGVMVASSVPTFAIGTAATGVLWASGHADPAVIGMICAAPAAVAVPIFALARVLRRAKETVEAAPPVHHHHYNGPVHQDHRSINTQTRGVWAKTSNELPR